METGDPVKDNVEWVKCECAMCGLQVALSLQQWRYVTVLSGLALWERYQPNLDSQQSTCSSRTSAKQSSRAVLALLQLLTQDIHKGNGSSPPVVFVLMPSGSLAVFWLILNFVTGDLALYPEARPCQTTNSWTPSIWNQNYVQLALRLAGSIHTYERSTKSRLFCVQSSFLRLH